MEQLIDTSTGRSGPHGNRLLAAGLVVLLLAGAVVAHAAAATAAEGAPAAMTQDDGDDGTTGGEGADGGESSVSLRLGADAASQTDLIQDARGTVDERRLQFGQAIEPVAAARR